MIARCPKHNRRHRSGLVCQQPVPVVEEPFVASLRARGRAGYRFLLFDDTEPEVIAVLLMPADRLPRRVVRVRG